jgi:membrane fusion protein, multidrug efflux system
VTAPSEPPLDDTTRTSRRPASANTPAKAARGGRLIPLAMLGSAATLLALGALLLLRAEAKTNRVALADAPKPVSVILAKASSFRADRSYVGTLRPWVEASVGPQLVSAFVETVLVRPGAVVKKGDVLATLDCRNASATTQAITMQAQALEASQRAAAHEATRVQGLLDGGFVSANEAEQKSAQSQADEAQLLATRARLLGSSLEVNDCVLRAPFAGEIATRSIDPGAFVRPGSAIVSVVDRSTVRIVADAPELDFDVVAPGREVKVHLVSTGRDLVATIARRAPAADLATRTVHFELDVDDADRSLPVGTTAELHIEVGEPEPATEIPLYAATVRGNKAQVFVVAGDRAKKTTVAIQGERAGQLFLAPELPAGAKVVTEGRALLNDNDRVTALLEQASSSVPPSVASVDAKHASNVPGQPGNEPGHEP